MNKRAMALLMAVLIVPLIVASPTEAQKIAPTSTMSDISSATSGQPAPSWIYPPDAPSDTQYYDYSWVVLNSRTVAVFNQPGAEVSVTLKTASGSAKETQTGTTTGSGSFPRVVLYFTAPFNTGDVIVVKVPNRTYEVPIVPLSIEIDTDLDVVSGIGRPGDQQMFIDTWASPCDAYKQFLAPIDASGHYRADLHGEVDITAGDRIRSVYWASGNAVEIGGYAPGTRMMVGGSTVSGWGPAAGEAVTLELSDNAHRVKGRSQTITDPQFYFSQQLRDPNTRLPATISPGDELLVTIGSRSRSISVPTLTAAFDLSTGTISGAAPANQPLEVAAAHWAGTGYVTKDTCKSVTSSSSGLYADAFTSPPSLSLGDYGMVDFFNTAGDHFYANGFTTSPSLSNASYPSWINSGTPVTINWEVDSGAQHVTSTQVRWDTVSHPFDSDYAFRTTVQTGAAGVFSATLNGNVPEKGTVYFRVIADVDGRSLESPEYWVVIDSGDAHRTFLPLLIR